MIYELFVRIIDMSITASVVMIAVFIARGFMGRLPKRYSYLLWAIVAVRLLCPVGVASPVSVFNLFGQHNGLPVELQSESTEERVSEWKDDENSSLVGNSAGQEGKEGGESPSGISGIAGTDETCRRKPGEHGETIPEGDF